LAKDIARRRYEDGPCGQAVECGAQALLVSIRLGKAPVNLQGSTQVRKQGTDHSDLGFAEQAVLSTTNADGGPARWVGVDDAGQPANILMVPAELVVERGPFEAPCGNQLLSESYCPCSKQTTRGHVDR
jgi:hypothetical protein